MIQVRKKHISHPSVIVLVNGGVTTVPTPLWEREPIERSCGGSGGDEGQLRCRRRASEG